MTTRAIIYSLAICALGLLLEGAFAGSGIRKHLASLRLPSYAVPFWGWIVIGALYYSAQATHSADDALLASLGTLAVAIAVTAGLLRMLGRVAA